MLECIHSGDVQSDVVVTQLVFKTAKGSPANPALVRRNPVEILSNERPGSEGNASGASWAAWDPAPKDWQ